MKFLKRKIMKIAMCVIIAVMMVVPMTAFADGGTFGISASTSTVAPNGSFTVSIGGQCAGRVDVSVSNGSADASKVWVDVGQKATVTITAGSSGTVTVTAVPFEGFSDPDAMVFNPGSKSVSVTIVEPTPDPEPEDPDTPSGGGSDKPSGGDSNKPSGGDSNKPSGGDSNKPSGGDTSKPDTPTDDELVGDEPEVDEPVLDEPVGDEPEVDEPVLDEPVVDEPVVDEPAEKGCMIHWIILVVMIIGAILTFVFRKNMLLDIAILAVAAIISVILSAVVGNCMVDWIITVIGIVVLAIMSMMLSKQTKAKTE